MIHLENLQEALKLTDPADDGPAFTLMERVLDSVSRRVDRYFGEVMLFEPQALTGGSEWLFLNETPVISDARPFLVESNTSGVWETVDSATYALVYSGKVEQPPRVSLIGGWTASNALTTPKLNLRATYYAGYEIGGLPGDIEEMVLSLTARRWLNRGHENMKSEKFGDAYAYVRADNGGSGDPWAEWQHIIDIWRVPVFA